MFVPAQVLVHGSMVCQTSRDGPFILLSPEVEVALDAAYSSGNTLEHVWELLVEVTNTASPREPFELRDFGVVFGHMQHVDRILPRAIALYDVAVEFVRMPGQCDHVSIENQCECAGWHTQGFQGVSLDHPGCDCSRQGLSPRPYNRTQPISP